MKMSTIFNTDSYKVSHWRQYPPKTDIIGSYITARGSSKFDGVLYAGLQAYLLEYLTKPITKADIEEAALVYKVHGVELNVDGWTRILTRHDGLMPVDIYSIPEGSFVPTRTPLVQVFNTDVELPWVTSWIETALLRAIWYMSTVATLSFHIKRDLIETAKATGTRIELVDTMLHDMGARGCSSNESAMLGGIGHLINFGGTDTVASLIGAQRYYYCSICGYSIPAAEHSTITTWGKEYEVGAYRNMIEAYGTHGKMFAVVSDSYDIYHAVEHIWGEILKDEVEDSKATLVVRCDSGDPTVVPIEVIKKLMDKFGHFTNQKGFKVLPSCVRVLQSDGINREQIKKILDALVDNGLALDNIAFGMGGALLQHPNRDDLSFSMKANIIYKDGSIRDVSKTPSGDTLKASDGGVYNVLRDENGTYTNVYDTSLSHKDGLMQLRYSNGKIRKDASTTMMKMRDLARSAL